MLSVNVRVTVFIMPPDDSVSSALGSCLSSHQDVLHATFVGFEIEEVRGALKQIGLVTLNVEQPECWSVLCARVQRALSIGYYKRYTEAEDDYYDEQFKGYYCFCILQREVYTSEHRKDLWNLMGRIYMVDRAAVLVLQQDVALLPEQILYIRGLPPDTWVFDRLAVR